MANQHQLDETLLDCGRSESELLALPLVGGSHGGNFIGECCLVEKSNRIASCIPAFRERFGASKFSDDHPSISPVCRALAIGLNDLPWSSVEERTQSLDRFSIALLGTKTGEADEITRGFMCVDWLVRVNTPAWLRLAGLTSEAQTLESLARVVDATTAGVAAASAASAARAASAASAAWAARAARAASAASAAWAARAASAAWAARAASAARAAWADWADWAARAAKYETLSTELRASLITLLDVLIGVGKP